MAEKMRIAVVVVVAVAVGWWMAYAAYGAKAEAFDQLSGMVSVK